MDITIILMNGEEKKFNNISCLEKPDTDGNIDFNTSGITVHNTGERNRVKFMDEYGCDVEFYKSSIAGYILSGIEDTE